MIRTLVASSLALFSFGCVDETPESNSRCAGTAVLLFDNAELIDLTADGVRSGMSVVVADGVICDIGTTVDLPP